MALIRNTWIVVGYWLNAELYRPTVWAQVCCTEGSDGRYYGIRVALYRWISCLVRCELLFFRGMSKTAGYDVA